MNKQSIQFTDLTPEQILSVINKGIDRAHKGIDNFIEMDMDMDIEDATFDIAAKIHQMQIMLMAAELSKEIRLFTQICELQAIEEAIANGVDIDDKEAFYEVAEDVIHQQKKYCDLNNEILGALLFEISKDILSEIEFTIAIL